MAMTRGKLRCRATTRSTLDADAAGRDSSTARGKRVHAEAEEPVSQCTRSKRQLTGRPLATLTNGSLSTSTSFTSIVASSSGWSSASVSAARDRPRRPCTRASMGSSPSVRPRKRAAAAIKPPESETSVIPTCFPAKEESTANEVGKADEVDDKGEGDALGEAAAATNDPADGAVDAPSKTNKWYNNAVLDHLCDLERGHHVGNVYMLFQGDITPQMRAILVDWLVEVNTEYQFSQQTLHLTVVLLDRYLSRMPVKRLKLQLVGITCMLIACKFEEICIPSLDSFIQISDFTFTREEILRMEAVVLLKLDFAIAAATASSFLSRYIAAAALEGVTVDGQIEHLSHFLCELALQDYACLRFMPSAIAAAAICLAQICVASPPHGSGQIAKCTQYSSEELRPCVLEMHALFRRSATSNLIATQSKYASPHRLEVSRITPPPVLPPF